MMHSLLVILQKDEKGMTSQIAAKFDVIVLFRSQFSPKKKGHHAKPKINVIFFYCLDAARLLLRSISMS